MKKYILMILFFLNFAFVFQEGKMEVSVGMEMKAADNFAGESGDSKGQGDEPPCSICYEMPCTCIKCTSKTTVYEDLEEINCYRLIAKYEVEVVCYTHEELSRNLVEVHHEYICANGELCFCGNLMIDCNKNCQTCPCPEKCTTPRCEGEHCIVQRCQYCGVDGDNEKCQTCPCFIKCTKPWCQGEHCVGACPDGSEPCQYCQQCGCSGQCQIPPDPPIVNDEEVPEIDEEGYFKPTKSDNFPPSAKEEADRIKNIMGFSADIVQKINILKGEAANKGANKYEYGIAINKNTTGFYVYKGPINGELQTDELVGSVGVEYNKDTQVTIHNHTDPSLKTLSSIDVNNLLSQYKYIRNYGGDYKAKIQIAPDQSQSMVYVHDKTKLDAFIQKYGDNLIKDGEKVFNENKKIGIDFKDVYKTLKDQGYSPSVAYRYTLTYVLDKYQTGLKMFFKEPGAADFKQQGIKLTPFTTPSGKTITLYKPLISK